jgi:hypothetical protein
MKLHEVMIQITCLNLINLRWQALLREDNSEAIALGPHEHHDKMEKL